MLDEGRFVMATSSRILHKHFRLDAVKLQRAQKVLAAATETETVERALDLAISEHERNKKAAVANRRFLKSRIRIRDVYGNLDQ
jgi:hypothetical protein